MEALGKKAKEAEVESRTVYPLLTSSQHLAIPPKNVRDKKYLYPRQLDKASGKTTGYYPDYSVWDEAFPFLSSRRRLLL